MSKLCEWQSILRFQYCPRMNKQKTRNSWAIFANGEYFKFSIESTRTIFEYISIVLGRAEHKFEAAIFLASISCEPSTWDRPMIASSSCLQNYGWITIGTWEQQAHLGHWEKWFPGAITSYSSMNFCYQGKRRKIALKKQEFQYIII